MGWRWEQGKNDDAQMKWLGSFLTFMFQLITSLPPQNKSFWQLMPPSTRRIHNAFLLLLLLLL
jgi:cell division protein FtsB